MRVGELAVVFDLDGTLLDTMTSAPTAYAHTIRARGGPTVAPAEVVAAWHLGPMPAVLAHFLGRPVSAADVDCFHRHFETEAASARPFPGVVGMLDALGRAGYRLGVFTGAVRRAATGVLAATGIRGHFSTVVCGDDISAPKPAPDGLRLACRHLDVDAAETAYVGDDPVDLRCARSAGALDVHARWGGAATAPEGASVVAHRPSDLVDLFVTPGRRRRQT